MHEMIDTPCPLCGDTANFTVLYPQNFQPGDLNAEIFSARRLPDRLHYRLVRCRRDGMVRSTPIMCQDGLADLYRESHFTYQEETTALSRTYVRALAPALARIGKDGRILEVGCGNGFVLSALIDMGYPNVFGVEPGREAVESATISLRSRITTDVLRPGLHAPSSFDLIAFFQVLDHIPDPNAFLKDCALLLKPGGYVVAFQHNVRGWSHRVMGERCPIVDVEHTHLYDPKTVSALFSLQGFRVVKVSCPANLVTLRHLVWLAPLPVRLKKAILAVKTPWFSRVLALTLWLKLGNLCILAQKTSVVR